jgi:hypothetical protein
MVAAGVYLDGNIVGLSVPGLLGIPHDPMMAGGAVAILLAVSLLPVALIARAGNGVVSAALVTAAAVLAGQAATVVLASAGVPGLLQWDHAHGEVVLEGFMEAGMIALLALVPATAAAACTAAVLRLTRSARPGHGRI